MSRIKKLFTNPLGVVYSDPVIDRLIPRRRKHAWLTSAPKSGSTWLNEILTALLGWPSLFLVPCYDRREHEIDSRRLLLAPRGDNIYSPSLHTRCNEETLEVLRKGNIQVVVLVRNLFDSVVSFRDHLNRSFQDHAGRQPIEWSMAYVDEASFGRLSDERKTDFVIDMVVPWFFNFYCGWAESGIMGEGGQAILMTYERLRGDPRLAVREICRFLEVEKTDDEILGAIEAAKMKNTRKNKAVTDRGKTFLTEAQRRRIVSYADYYPGIDFSPLGITR